MLVPYNSTLDDGNSDNTWMKGWSCSGNPMTSYPLPIDLSGHDAAAVAAARLAAADAPTADKTFPLRITTQDACYTECQKTLKFIRSAEVFDPKKRPFGVDANSMSKYGCCTWTEPKPIYADGYYVKDQFAGCRMSEGTGMAYTG